MKARTSVLLLLSLAQVVVPVLFLSFQRACDISLEEELPGSGGSGGGIRRCEKLLLVQARYPRRRTEVDPEVGSRVTASDVLHSQVRRVRVEEEDLEELRAASAQFNLSDPRTRSVVQLVKRFTQAWAPTGAGRSAWSVRHVREAVLGNAPLACCAHVRVVEGKVYIRYGLQSLREQFRLDRANDLATFLQATVEAFELGGVRAELLFNTCDHALSREGSMPGDRSNYLVWTPHVTDGVDNDVVVPDLLDLRPSYMQSREAAAAARAAAPPWGDKLPKAVFRGATTNYALRGANWVSSPRLRLHRMTDGMPDMLDARVTRWSHVTGRGGARELEREAGLALGGRMNETDKGAFKYEMIVDGGLGGGRLCGVLLADRALLMQSSPFFQFFYPLLRRGRHFMETHHSFRDLAPTLAYMRQHDGEMRDMVERAHRELGWTCSIRGRMLAFAVLLVKYHAIQDPLFYRTGVHDADSRRFIRVPDARSRCAWGPATSVRDYGGGVLPRHDRLECPPAAESDDARPPRSLPMPGCPATCFKGLRESDWRWVAADDLRGVPGMDWWKTHVPET